jgi:DnaJ-class molecular chaperone
MSTKRSAYEVLGVGRAASGAEIRRAYKLLVRSEHPDIIGGGAAAHERFLEIKAAYEILADPARRSAYDRDPGTTLEVQIAIELRSAQLRRRKRRLRRLYEA